jgi:hypothetical protein
MESNSRKKKKQLDTLNKRKERRRHRQTCKKKHQKSRWENRMNILVGGKRGRERISTYLKFPGIFQLVFVRGISYK